MQKNHHSIRLSEINRTFASFSPRMIRFPLLLFATTDRNSVNISPGPLAITLEAPVHVERNDLTSSCKSGLLEDCSPSGFASLVD